ncbi:ATP-binding protein [Paucibacter sp. hw8]|uniref:histidine kinase n=2 Tax=Roseateles albus TaxID=2987525 RepID=A0ABT5KBV1_9BURK|nr:ATP-binding protein [Roseateles albus]MDC8771410.1 ATP-binding protein [Roseateles albus]
MKPRLASPSTDADFNRQHRFLPRLRLGLRGQGLMSFLTLALIAMVGLGLLLGQRWSERAGMAQLAAVGAERLELYAASLEAELARHAYLPSLIAIDADLQALLNAPQDVELRQHANRKLAGINVRAGLGLSMVLDTEGQVLAASDGSGAGSASARAAQRFAAYLAAATEQASGHFFAADETNGSSNYFLMHTLKRGGKHVGQVVVMQNLAPLEATWVDQGLRSQGEKILVVDDREVVIMSSVPQWRNHWLNPRSAEQLAALQASPRYTGPLSGPLGLFVHEDLQQEAALIQVPSLNKHEATGGTGPSREQQLLAQERAVLPLALRLVTLSDPAEVWRQARYAAWGGGAIGASIGMLGIYLAARRRAHAQLFAASSALQLAHAQLERQVDARTQELSQTNRELKRQIAQRLQAEDELMQSAKLAVLGQMSAGIAHEINQPLTAMRALSRNGLLLLEKGRNASVAENLQSIDAMVERMTGITRQLKSFARKAEAAHAPVSLLRAIGGARLLLEHRIKAEGIDVRVEVSEALLLRCEANRLEQVLVNLLGNAIDAMKDAAVKRLSISAKPMTGSAGKRALVQIIDTGPGIAPDLAARLFEPFFTTKPAGQGLGLGLVISSKIIHEFGGSLRAIAIEAELGGGMMFEFDLEVSKEDGPHV